MQETLYLVGRDRAARYLSNFSLTLAQLEVEGRLKAVRFRGESLYHIGDLVTLTWQLDERGEVAPECRPDKLAWGEVAA
jgi:hypothetical protein